MAVRPSRRAPIGNAFGSLGNPSKSSTRRLFSVRLSDTTRRTGDECLSFRVNVLTGAEMTSFFFLLLLMFFPRVGAEKLRSCSMAPST